MSGQMKDFSQELVKLYLEDRGYLAAFGVTCTIECVPEKSQSRNDHEIDVVAVRIVGGQAESAIVGCIKGNWASSSYLTPSMIRSLERDKKTFSRAFSEARINFLAGRYGLGKIPVKKILFHSLRSPKKALEAESALRMDGIEVVYQEDIIAEILPRMGKDPYLASGTALQTIRALRGSALFASRKQTKTNEGKPAKRKKQQAEKDVVKEPQLPLFG